MRAYSEQRYASIVPSKPSAVPLEHMPYHAGLHYNYACFATLAGDTGDDTFAHLRRSVELLPRFREDARRDADFAAVRDDPRFEQALRSTRCDRRSTSSAFCAVVLEDGAGSIGGGWP